MVKLVNVSVTFVFTDVAPIELPHPQQAILLSTGCSLDLSVILYFPSTFV